MKLVFLLWSAAAVWAAPQIALEAPETATLGVPLTLKASAAAQDGWAFETVRSSTASFAVLTAARQPDPAAFAVTLLPLDLGKHSFDLIWTFKSADGSLRTAATPMALTVAEPESLKQNSELEDIKPPWRARRVWWPWLLAALIAAAAVLLWRRGRGTAASTFAAEAADARTPEQRAEDELLALERSGVWAEGRHKDFYLRLTDIVRAYLEERRSIAAARLTTTELFYALRRQEDGRQAINLIRETFQRADLVKFAKAPAAPSWAAEDLAAARALVKALSPHDLATQQETKT